MQQTKMKMNKLSSFSLTGIIIILPSYTFCTLKIFQGFKILKQIRFINRSLKSRSKYLTTKLSNLHYNYFVHLISTRRTGEEKKVFVNAIKEAKKLSKLCSSVPMLGKARSFAFKPKTLTVEKPTIKKKPSFGKRDAERKSVPSPMLPRFGGKKLFGKMSS